MPPSIDTATVGECGDFDVFKNAQCSQCKLKMPQGWDFASHRSSMQPLLQQYPFGSGNIMLSKGFAVHHCGYHWGQDKSDTCGGYYTTDLGGNEQVKGDDTNGYYVSDSSRGDGCPSSGRILIACDSGSTPPFSCKSRNGVNDWLTGCTEEAASGAAQLNSLVSGDPFTCIAHLGSIFPHAINRAACETAVIELNSVLMESVAPSIGSKIYSSGNQQKFPELFCGIQGSDGIAENSGVRTKGGKEQCDIAASMLNVYFGLAPATAADCETSISGSGFPFNEISVIKEGHTTWSDRSYKWKDVPDELDGARYFKSGDKYPPDGNSPATLKNEGTSDVDVYILYEPEGSADVNRDGGFGSGVAGFSDTGLTIDSGMNSNNAGPLKILKKNTPLPPGGSVTLPELDPIERCTNTNSDELHDPGDPSSGACHWVGAYAMKCRPSTTTTAAATTTKTTMTTATTTTVSELSLRSSDCNLFLEAMAAATSSDKPSETAEIACDPRVNDGELSTTPAECFAAAEQLNTILRGSQTTTATTAAGSKATGSAHHFDGKVNIDDPNFCAGLDADPAECDSVTEDDCSTTRFAVNYTTECPFLCICGSGTVGADTDDDATNDTGISTGSIAGIAAGLVLVFIGVVVFTTRYTKRSKRKSKTPDANTMSLQLPATYDNSVFTNPRATADDNTYGNVLSDGFTPNACELSATHLPPQPLEHAPSSSNDGQLSKSTMDVLESFAGGYAAEIYSHLATFGQITSSSPQYASMIRKSSSSSVIERPNPRVVSLYASVENNEEDEMYGTAESYEHTVDRTAADMQTRTDKLTEQEKWEELEKATQAMSAHQSEYDALFAKWSGAPWIDALEIEHKIVEKYIVKENVTQPNPWSKNQVVKVTSKRYMLKLLSIYDHEKSATSPVHIVAAACHRIAGDTKLGKSAVEFMLGKVKSQKRIIEKVRTNKGRFDLIRDYARATFILKDVSKFPDLLRLLLVEKDFTVIRAKNRLNKTWDTQKSAGYRDYQVLVQTTDGWIVELQLIPEGMYTLKSTLGHADYAKYRFIVEAGKRAREREVWKMEEDTNV